MEEDEQLERAIAASLESHLKEQELQQLTDQVTIEASFASHQQHVQLQASEQLALSLQQQEEDDQIEMAVEESYESNEREKLHHQMNNYATEYSIERSNDQRAGCWDCPACTLVNSPYAAQCNACKTKAPIHILTFEPLPAIRFGLEIEIVVPMGKRDGFTLESLAKNLTKLGQKKVDFLGYTHTVTNNWKIVTDSSIRANNGVNQDLCFELVSPVLQGDEGLAQLRSIMESVRRIGIATNTSCGFHVHVDAETGSPIANMNSLKAISQCFVSVENAFDLIVSNNNRHTNRNRYCNSNRIAFGSMSSRQRWNEIESAYNRYELVKMMNPNDDRYRKLNLTNLTNSNRPSTIEFRHHGGVQDLQEAEAWVRLVLLFCQNARTKKNVCILSESSSVKDEVTALFTLVGCNGLEQLFTIDRRLFSQQMGNNVWKCKTCRRPFDSSRSLSQHCSAVGHRMH